MANLRLQLIKFKRTWRILSQRFSITKKKTRL